MTQSAHAAKLQLGRATVENDRISVPVFLEGSLEAPPAAMDFRIRYDPSALRVLDAEPGREAQQVGKRLMANEPVRGQYIVLIMGFNDQTILPGHMATLYFAEAAEAEAQTTRLELGSVTLSTVQGEAMRGEGSELAVEIAGQRPASPGEEQGDASSPDDSPEAPGEQPGGHAEAPAPDGDAALSRTIPGSAGQEAPASTAPDAQALGDAVEAARRARAAVTPPAGPRLRGPEPHEDVAAAERLLMQTPQADGEVQALSADEAGEDWLVDGGDSAMESASISSPEARDDATTAGEVSEQSKRMLFGIAAGVLVLLVVLRQRLVR